MRKTTVLLIPPLERPKRCPNFKGYLLDLVYCMSFFAVLDMFEGTKKL